MRCCRTSLGVAAVVLVVVVVVALAVRELPRQEVAL